MPPSPPDAATADLDQPTVTVRNDHQWTIRVTHTLEARIALYYEKYQDEIEKPIDRSTL
ncbi:MAG: hypothetical protein ABI591_04470 [Kofleriaceae bacterium]